MDQRLIILYFCVNELSALVTNDNRATTLGSKAMPISSVMCDSHEAKLSIAQVTLDSDSNRPHLTSTSGRGRF
jgi:hypothetical protein